MILAENVKKECNSQRVTDVAWKLAASKEYHNCLDEIGPNHTYTRLNGAPLLMHSSEGKDLEKIPSNISESLRFYVEN